MKRLFKNKSMVTVISLIVCLVVLLFAYRYRVNTAISSINVPIAVRQINGREKITEKDIKTVKVAQSMTSKNVIREKSNIIDRYVNYNTFIPEGSMFYENAVVDWKSMPDSTWAEINNDNTIVSISAKDDAISSFGNSIYPGDTIDLYYQNTNDNKLFIGKLIEGIKVLAVKDANGEHIFKKSSQQTAAAALIFSVPEELHLLLRRAQLVGGHIIPVPRNASYSNEEEHAVVASDYIKNFINSRSRNLVSDYEDQTTTTTDTTPKITE